MALEEGTISESKQSSVFAMDWQIALTCQGSNVIDEAVYRIEKIYVLFVKLAMIEAITMQRALDMVITGEYPPITNSPITFR